MNNPAPPAAALDFPFAQPPAPGTAIEAAPGVFWLRMPLPFALNHINLWALRDGAGWTLIDCGLNTETTRALWEQHFGGLLAGAHIERVLVTHFHPDHVGLAGWLTQRLDAPLWMSESEYLMAHVSYAELPGHRRDDQLALYRLHGLEAQREDSMRALAHSYRRGITEPPGAFRRLLEDDDLTIGGRAWRVMMGYGHAPEHAALYCEALGVLISGDMVLPTISTNVSVWPEQPDADPLALFLASLDRYARLPADTLVLPSHGLPFRGVRVRAAALHAHHDARLSEVLQACERPVTAAQIVPVLFRRVLDDHQMSFAMGEAIAHLNYLHQRGQLQREAADGMLRYVRCDHNDSK
jgi:glyoxylase-like metal-dependent hydrolase (beta-lactamase superfamily II)